MRPKPDATADLPRAGSTARIRPGDEAARVTRDLTRMIIALELEPGQGISQAELCERLKCGRMPLREAIQRLMHTGLIVHTPNRGIVIAPMDVWEYRSALELSEILGVAAARLACQRATEGQMQQLRELRSVLRQTVENEPATSPVSGHQEYVALMCEASGNPLLFDAWDRASAIVYRFANSFYRRNPTLEPYHNITIDIIGAVCDRDTDRAERLLHEGNAAVRARLLAEFAGISVTR